MQNVKIFTGAGFVNQNFTPKQVSYALSKCHLCFTITEKGHMIVPDRYYRILSYTKTYGKNKFFQLKCHENLIQCYLIVDFR